MPSIFLIAILLAAGVTGLTLHTHRCSTNTQVAGTYVNGSVSMNDNPWIHFDAPMTQGFNLTNGEDWSFEGASTDGESGMGFTFSRGTVAGHTLAQRMFFAVVWPNGTRFMESTFADYSTINICRGLIKGTWYNGTSGMNWTFETSEDYSRTVVKVQSATVQGTFTLHARSPAVYPNGLIYPHPHGDNLFAPYLYWVENVPVGVAAANLTIRGTPFVLKGIGGRERNWNSFAWAQVSARWDMFRAKIGPYTLMVWTFESKVDGQTYFSGVLMEEMNVLFRTRTQQVSTTKNYGSFSLQNNGMVRLSSETNSATPLPKSRHTGYLLEMVAPTTGERWRFEVDYTKCVYWFPAGPSARLGGFVGAIKGGLVGGPQHSGRASGTAMEKD
ncbi:uncharacterized protein CC84DRAFT_1234719 [Paraphaeosphaeria sporulosa]|uniref:AttH domain-containing protein n=1 Tax=Paraphaeosphaeria sporulosa TaxID=1460663 RepID=A0A177CP62_9PLEO|nr:uncharacterized protein CC84DRAFT_1234719 [Paraphaeosphaeria sporulosa]OAG09325.1 hypothetical protein CC84DRAFT_1234719 [Paraphaeosphaeria sporulosa]